MLNFAEIFLIFLSFFHPYFIPLKKKAAPPHKEETLLLDCKMSLSFQSLLMLTC